MRARAAIVLALIIGYILVMAFASVVKTISMRYPTPSHPRPSVSPAESTARNALVSELSLDPKQFQFRRKKFTVDRVWLEKRVRQDTAIILVPGLWELYFNRPEPGYYLCLTIRDSNAYSRFEDIPDLYLLRNGAYFGRRGTEIFFFESEVDVILDDEIIVKGDESEPPKKLIMSSIADR